MEFFEKFSSHNIDIFRHRLHVIATTDPLASARKHIKTFSRTSPIRAIHIVLEGQGNSMIIIPLDVQPGELAHECNHAVMHIISEIGAGYKEDEFVCYLLAHIVEIATDALNSAKKERKKLQKELDKVDPNVVT